MCNVKREEFHQQHDKRDLCQCNPINHVTEKTLGSPMWYRVTGVVPRENIRQSYVVSGDRGGSQRKH